MSRRVVITGMGLVSPLGTSVQEAWQAILAKQSGIMRLGPEYDHLPCKIGGLVTENGSKMELSRHFTKSELKTMAPATAYALLAAKSALADSKLVLSEEVKERTGVAVGMGMVDLADICNTNDALRRGYNQVSPFFVPRILLNMAAGQISIKYGLRGPNHAVSTACATGAHSIGDSLRFIQDGAADAMLCGGTEACVSPLSLAAFCRLRALSTTHNDQPEIASRPFDAKREGFVMSEGSAILVLEELRHALDRSATIYAEILGYGLSGDASHLTSPSPDGKGAILAMKRALEHAKVPLESVSYVNAHATSTPIGDAIEIRAIEGLFLNHANKIAVSSTKGAHGHLLGAAGNLETVFAVKAIQESTLPPTLNLSSFENKCHVNFIKEAEHWQDDRRILLKNAFGFGGTNASLCIGKYIS